MPNLIAHDLVLVAPMSSMVGYVSYIEYTLGNGEMINNPFTMGDITETRTSYTKSSVVEQIANEEITVVDNHATFSLSWKADITDTAGLVGGKVIVAGTTYTYDSTLATAGTYKVANTAGVTVITLYDATAPTGVVKAAYQYDNITIPFNNGVGTMPTLKAEMKSIALQAKARRLAIYYSSIAAFQAKTDYGFDLGDALAEQAVGELQFEIDCEVISVLDELAGSTPVVALTWSKTLPVGVNNTLDLVA